MPTEMEILVGGDWTVGESSVEAIPQSSDGPEWHRLRLFGRGRHPSGFDAGVEMRDEL